MAGEVRRGVAVGLGVLGTAGIVFAVAGKSLGTYISEAGVPGSGHSLLYRASVLAIAVTAALTATLGLPRLTAVTLAAAAPAVAVSGAVTCTDGCPLPPKDPTTLPDLIHAAASIAGVGLCALAMAALALRSGNSGRSHGLRQVSVVAAVFAWPLLIATGIGIGLLGHSVFTGAAERLAVAVCLAWLILAAALSGPARQRRKAG